MFAGIGAGAAQIAGPAVILYWLSRGNNATTLRANLMVFFVFCGVILIAVYAAQGLFTARLIALALLFTPCYIVGVAIGSRSFPQRVGPALPQRRLCDLSLGRDP